MSSQEGQPPGLPEASDVLVSTAVALVNLAGIRLTEKEHRNPAKAKEAIDAARGMLALCPEEAIAPIKDALAQVQLLYVKERQPGPEGPASGAEAGGAAAAGAAGPADASAGTTQEEREREAREQREREEREKARAKIWTPPGA